MFCILIILFLAAICFTGYKWLEYGIARKIRETPVSQRARIIAHHREFGGLHIKSGMLKRQIEKFVGLPQNSDSRHVWAWGFDGDNNPEKDSTWLDLMDDGIVYIVFLDDRAIGKALCVEVSAAVTPAELVMSVKDCDERTALTLLGLSESEIESYNARNAETKKARGLSRSKKAP
jgi:hypothetical protein